MQDVNCAWSSYHKNQKYCNLYQNCYRIEKNSEIISRPKDCQNSGGKSHIVHVELANLNDYNNELLKNVKKFDYRMWPRLPWINKFPDWK